MRPTYDLETLQAYFQQVSEATVADPIVGPILRRLAVEDPDLIAAVADVDRSQIRDQLALTPAERLENASQLARSLEGYRRVAG